MTEINPNNPHAASADATPPDAGSSVARLFEEMADICRRLRQTDPNPTQEQLLTTLEHLHLTLQQKVAPVRQDPLPSPADPDPPSSHALHILLAEDNLLTQKLMVRMLELRGHRVEVVDNGEKAVHAASHTLFDLLLMDIRMPVMDGLQASRTIRQQEGAHHKKHLPILALTVLTSEADRTQCLEAGMDGFHSKPVKAELLFAEIDRILATPATRPAPEPPEARKGRLETLDHLSRSVDGDVQLIREVVELFFTQSREQLPKIRRAIEEGATTELMEVAHSLKGAAGAFGPSRIHQLAYQLEVAGRTANLDQAPAALAELEQEIRDTNIALQNALDKEEFHV